MWVLVVDDDVQVRRVARRGLEHHGHQVVEAEDGTVALGIVRELDVDVAVLDRQLPGMSGIELIGELRRVAPAVHIIMLTGAAAEADRVLGLMSGADDYMVKPFSARELAARVTSVRRRRATLTTPSPAAAPDSGEVEAATQPVVMLQHGRIVTANDAALGLFGAETRQQVVDRDVSTFLSAETVTALNEVSERDRGGTRWAIPELVVVSRVDGAPQRVLASATASQWAGEPASRVSLWPQAEPVVDSAPEAHSADDVDIAADIRRGLACHEFVVHYQPIVRLADSRTVGFEALVRWQHPERGLLSPASFMDAAERTGAVVELGTFVLNAARLQWAVWNDSGHRFYVSVNLSGAQLADPNLPSLIAATPLPEGQLWLEVTETSLVQDLAQAGQTLGRVTALGPKVAIDDFGTGWASMTYLREFPVHALKIDRSFVHGAGTSTVDTAIAASVLSLGRELGLHVIAEGIETPGQRDQLRDLGCELGQGYLFGRPVPPDQLYLEAP